MSPTPDLFRVLGALCEAPDPAHRRLAELLGLPGCPDPAGYTELFVLNLVPYAAVYLSPDGMLGGETADRVAGFWRALHLDPPPEPDHLAALLGLYASLSENERDQADPARRLLYRQARGTLLREHLLSWLPAYTAAVARTASTGAAGSPCYAGWARLLDAALRAEAATLRPEAATLRPEAATLPARAPAVPAEAEAPGVAAGPAGHPPDLADGLDALIRALLTPARSGLLLTRTDLARAARETGLAARVGDRAFMLRALLGQDPAAVFGWLAAEADRSARRHGADEALLGPLATAWRVRAEASRDVLHSGQRQAREVVHAA